MPAGDAYGAVEIRSADSKLCLGFDANTSAYGGKGNSVVARPCVGQNGDRISNRSNRSNRSDDGGGGVTTWKWAEEVGGSFLRTSIPHPSCSGFPGQAASCECAHPVECTACHGADEYTPPTSVELTTCEEGSHMDWSSLAVNDGKGGGAGGSSSGGVLLMTGGLCLQGPGDEGINTAKENAGPGRNGPLRQRQQRVQAKSAADVAAEAAPAPLITKVRVAVTATNGIADARILEIRLYDADGVAPFPKRPMQ